MNPIKTDGYMCLECESVYADEIEAQDCCPKDVEKVDGWKCSKCDEFYEDRDEAEYCCKEG